jgi:hypothetical protein
MNSYLPILVAVIRHSLALLGAGGALSDSDISQMAGALLVLASVAWSIYEKWPRGEAPAAPAQGEVGEVVYLVREAQKKYGKKDR